MSLRRGIQLMALFAATGLLAFSSACRDCDPDPPVIWQPPDAGVVDVGSGALDAAVDLSRPPDLAADTGVADTGVADAGVADAGPAIHLVLPQLAAAAGSVVTVPLTLEGEGVVTALEAYIYFDGSRLMAHGPGDVPPGVEPGTDAFAASKNTSSNITPLDPTDPNFALGNTRLSLLVFGYNLSPILDANGDGRRELAQLTWRVKNGTPSGTHLTLHLDQIEVIDALNQVINVGTIDGEVVVP